MDPITALGIATTAFKTIKKGMELGREIHGVQKELGVWMGAISDIRSQHARTKSSVFGKSVQEESLDTYVALQKANEMEHELKNFMVANYGLNAWDDVMKIQTQVAKQRKAELERIRAQHKLIVDVSLVLVIGLFSIGSLFYIIYLMATKL